MSVKFLAVAGFLVLAALPVQAAEVIDQSTLLTATTGTNFTASAITRALDPPSSRIQSMSVTAGKTGLLSRVDVQVYQFPGSGDLNLGIASGIAGQPGFATLGSFAIPRSSVPTSAESFGGSLVSVDVSSLGFDVVPGTVFSIVLGSAAQASGNNRFGWVFGESADGSDFNTLQVVNYAAGFNQTSGDDGVTWSPPTGADRGFRTWVDPGNAVPEPASWAMLIAGFGLTGAAMRRRRVTAA
jgi:hypothetical protein